MGRCEVKNLFYKRLVAVMRVMVIVSMLLGQNGVVVDVNAKDIGLPQTHLLLQLHKTG
jgi:hypothetical protein